MNRCTWLRVTSKLVAVAFVSLVLSASATLADRWGPPGDAAYHSKDQQFRFAVFPRVLSSAANYWREYDQGPHKRGQMLGARDVCTGQLEKRAADGSYAVVWKRELVNDVSPVGALVTSDGSHVVTFDNWHSKGYGVDVVVIYGPEGTLVASYGLADFLSKEQIARLPRSISSIGWGGAHRFDETEQHVVLQVVADKRDDNKPRPESLSVVISLNDGRVRKAGCQLAPDLPVSQLARAGSIWSPACRSVGSRRAPSIHRRSSTRLVLARRVFPVLRKHTGRGRGCTDVPNDPGGRFVCSLEASQLIKG